MQIYTWNKKLYTGVSVLALKNTWRDGVVNLVYGSTRTKEAKCNSNKGKLTWNKLREIPVKVMGRYKGKRSGILKHNPGKSVIRDVCKYMHHMEYVNSWLWALRAHPANITW